MRDLLLQYALLLKIYRALLAEFLGTAVLVAAVIGSGIMAQSLTSDPGLQLLINALSTILALGVLIWLFAEVSGSHFNPIVSMVAAIYKDLSFLHALEFIAAQFVGGLAGTALANAMFKAPLFESSHHVRTGSNLFLGEVVASAGLILLIFMRRAGSRPMYILVPAWIGSAYFFTSSTSFANPAVTFARAWSNSFAGIAPSSVLLFIVAQLLGGVLALLLLSLLNEKNRKEQING